MIVTEIKGQPMINKISKYPDTAEQSHWITQSRQGDNTAFCRIVEKYQRPVYNICYYMLKNTPDAEDAAQEVFLRAYTRLNTYDTTQQFSTWLFAIASHYCMDRWRKHSPQLVGWDDLQNSLSDRETGHPEKIALAGESNREVHALLETLKTDDRILIVLKYWQAMSYDEMAETLNTTAGAIKSKLFRARKTLALTLAEQNTVKRSPARRNTLVASTANA